MIRKNIKKFRVFSETGLQNEPKLCYNVIAPIKFSKKYE